MFEPERLDNWVGPDGYTEHGNLNTLMLQDALADPEWEDVLTPEDRRGLTPLFWSHVLPYGEVKLNMNSRLTLGGS